MTLDPPAKVKPPILGLIQARLVELLAEWQEPAYRAAQILEWVFKRRVLSFDDMTNLSRGLRAKRSLHGPMQRAACSTARSAEALIDFRKYSGYNEHVCLSCGRTLW